MVTKYIFKTSLMVVISTMFFAYAHADKIEIKIEKKIIFTNEPFEVNIKNNSNKDKVVNILGDDFLIVGKSVSSKITIINGEIKKENYYLFQLKAQNAGQKKFSIQIGDEIRGPFDIKVEKNNSKNEEDLEKGEPKYFAEFFIKKKNIYVNQPTEIKIIAYSREPIVRAAIKKGSFSHKGLYLIPIKIKIKDREKVIVKGKSFYKEVIAKYAIYALYPGEHKISDAEIILVMGRNSFFGLQTKRKDIFLPALSISALPMPEKNKPNNFLNNYGKYDISIEWEQDEVYLGNPATLIVTATGKGNLPILRFPKFDPMSVAKQIGNEAIEKDYVFNGETFVGSKTAKYYLLFYQSGEIKLPSLAFNSFDEEKGYSSHFVIPQKIMIKPSLANKTFIEERKLKNENEKKTIIFLKNVEKIPTNIFLNIEKKIVTFHLASFFIALLGPLYAIFFKRRKRKKEKRRQVLKESLKAWKKIKKDLKKNFNKELSKKEKKQMILKLQKILRKFLDGYYEFDIKKNSLEQFKKWLKENEEIELKEKMRRENIYKMLKHYESFLLSKKRDKLELKEELNFLYFLIKKKYN